MDINYLLTQIAIRSIFYFRIFGWVERLYINSVNFNVRPPVLIYQMGKVGSTSVYKSLKKFAIIHPIFHVHWFSKEGMVRAEKIKAEIRDPIFDMHLRRCKLLRSKYNNGNIKRLKIITLVRDPIDREVSNLFQNIEIFNRHLINHKKQIKINDALKLIRKKIELKLLDVDYCINWFDDEFNRALSVDIYDYPFDKEKGYSIIKYKHIDILIIKLEKANSCFKSAIKEFFGIQSEKKLVKANIGDKKRYSNEMKFIKENLRVSPKACESIYSVKYVNHFYSQKEINGFIAKWSKIQPL